MNIVLNRTAVVDSDWCFDNLCGSHLQSQSELYHVSWWYYTLVIDLIGQLRRDVIGRLSVKPWCYWLWRLVISNWCVSICLLSQLNSRLLLVKLSVVLLSNNIQWHSHDFFTRMHNFLNPRLCVLTVPNLFLVMICCTCVSWSTFALAYGWNDIPGWCENNIVTILDPLTEAPKLPILVNTLFKTNTRTLHLCNCALF